MHPYILPLAEQLEDLAEPERAVGAKAYMKNQFEFFGMPMAVRRAACKQYMKEHPLKTIGELEEIVKELWTLEQREFQYFGVELLAYHKKLWKEKIIDLLEDCIINKSWWDTVDYISNECNAKYFLLFPHQIKPVTTRWNRSKNIWLQRSSLLFQKSYKENIDTKLLTEFIGNLSSSKEFFVQKAIGWVLRDYAKVNPGWVIEFVGAHALPNLSKREAMKHLAPPKSSK
jgi:3-methyladenine DNA glycosylase AlkD